MFKLSPAILFIVLLISCTESNQKRYLYFKSENKVYEYMLESDKKRSIFKKKTPKIFLEVAPFGNYKEEYITQVLKAKNDGVILKAYQKKEMLFMIAVEFLNDKQYKIQTSEHILFPTARNIKYSQTHKYTDSIHTIPLKNQCWIELTDTKGITKIVWNGKGYVL